MYRPVFVAPPCTSTVTVFRSLAPRSRCYLQQSKIPLGLVIQAMALDMEEKDGGLEVVDFGAQVRVRWCSCPHKETLTMFPSVGDMSLRPACTGLGERSQDLGRGGCGSCRVFGRGVRSRGALRCSRRSGSVCRSTFLWFAHVLAEAPRPSGARLPSTSALMPYNRVVPGSVGRHLESVGGHPLDMAPCGGVVPRCACVVLQGGNTFPL